MPVILGRKGGGSGGGGAPSGPAGGDLSGTYPNPALSAAKQAELDGKVAKATFDANTILKADSDDTPVALTVGASTFVGRKAAGSIAAMSATEAAALLTDLVPKSLYDANTVLAADSDNTPAAVTMGASTILARLAAGNIKAASVAEIATLLGPALPGYELGYKAITSNATTTQTVEASATTIITMDAITFDGSTVLVQFFAPNVGHSVDQALILFNLWQDSTNMGFIATTRSCFGSASGAAVSGFVRYAPAAGSKVLTIRMFTSNAGTATVNAGAGGAATTYDPAFARVTKV